MHQDVESIMFTKEQLAARIGELAAQLDKEYAGKTPLMVGILKGSVMFYADLLRAMTIPVEMDFIAISSYGSGAKSSGEVKLIKDLDRKIEGKICALLDKYSRRVVPIEADYKGFDCADEFVVGFGLDYAERYRNLPYIGVLKRSVYEK